MNVTLAFTKFPAEAALIGRMLGGYTDIEVDLLNCVRTARQDLDTVLKAMYRNRGESGRIKVADAFGRQIYKSLKLGTEFETAIGAVRHCAGIRNQYAHCVWWDNNTGQLAFSNLEDLANQNVEVTNLHGLTTRYVNVALLTEQFAFFEYTSDYLVWLLQSANRISGRPHIPLLPKPTTRSNPPKHL